VHVVKRQYVPLQTSEKLKRFLDFDNPTITFYFKPHSINATAKNEGGTIKSIKMTNKTIKLTNKFLNAKDGNLKSFGTLADDIDAMVHDLGADSFTI
jgi:hypothetical protein